MWKIPLKPRIYLLLTKMNNHCKYPQFLLACRNSRCGLKCNQATTKLQSNEDVILTLFLSQLQNFVEIKWSNNQSTGLSLKNIWKNCTRYGSSALLNNFPVTNDYHSSRAYIEIDWKDAYVTCRKDSKRILFLINYDRF